METAEKQRSNESDAIVRGLFTPTPGTLLLAVGGYGREELFPYSDLDLIAIAEQEQAGPFVDLFRKLWDYGFRVSHSFRTLEECLTLDEENPELGFSLLDRRFLAGSRSVWSALDAGCEQTFSKRRDEFVLTAARLTCARHSRFQNTIYHLEPNVKDGPGGLRDYDVLRWFGLAGDLQEHAATLGDMRRALHRFFGRDGNVLTFEAQDVIGPAPDRLMIQYFRAARKVQRAIDEWIHHPTPVPLPSIEGWQELAAVLAGPQAIPILRQMHETGALGVLFPSWAAVDGLVIRDYYHQYTVDEHTLVALEAALRLRSDPPGPFANLARETSRYELLLVALLLHDTGKSTVTESHAEASAHSAGPELAAIGMPEEERELVLFLIGAHLELSRMMTTRDLTDPNTARAVLALTGTQERLVLLTLMTYADISGVNPHALTPWRTTLLWQLYTATVELPRSPAPPAPPKPGVTIEPIMEHGRGVWRLAISAPDRPFLFASVAGAISSFGMDIVRAEAFSTGAETACERFTFLDSFRTLELNPEEAKELERRVWRAAAGLEDVPKLLERRLRRRPPSESFDIHFDRDASQSATVLSVSAEDRPGLLYHLAEAISSEGCNIETVLIHTEGRKAMDVFYLTVAGRKLSPDQEERLSSRIGSKS